MSTSSFLNTIIAVLNDQPEIAELPNDKLVACRCEEGDILDEKIPTNLLYKVARLQTLISQVRENSGMPSYEIIRQIADETGVDFVTAGANALATSEDSVHRVMMIERLIVEVVHDAIPRECGKFDVRYLANPDLKIVRVPAQRHRFLD